MRKLKHLLVSRIHDAALRERASNYASGRLLDIGCGLKPYEETFAPYVDSHVGVDHPASPHGTTRADIVSSAYDIPVPDASFDTVVSTVVLEHLEDPLAAVREARRVLRPGGFAIYSAPFIWHLHEEPRDFYRFTKHGLNYVFSAAGFDVEEIKPLAGFWVTFGQLFTYYLYRFRRGPLRIIPIIPILGLIIQGVAYLLDRIDRAEEWTWLYMVVARAGAASDEA